jgi:hypothetical protein
MISVRFTTRTEPCRSFYHGYDFKDDNDRHGTRRINWNWREYVKFNADERLGVVSVAINKELVWDYAIGWLIDIDTFTL